MIKIELVNQLEQLTKLAEAIETFGEDNNLPMNVVFDINLSLDELVTNIVLYGYNDKNTHKIEVLLEKERDSVKITLIDDGREFDPTKKEKPNLDLEVEDKGIGGLGIHFVKTKMNEMTYKREENKNILTLVKIIN